MNLITISILIASTIMFPDHTTLLRFICILSTVYWFFYMGVTKTNVPNQTYHTTPKAHSYLPLQSLTQRMTSHSFNRPCQMLLTPSFLSQIITIGDTFLKEESDASQIWDLLYRGG